MRHRGEYPPDWPEIAQRLKEAHDWRCERCDAEHGPPPRVLTVHHLDGDKANCADWNLAVLCQRCHLHIQGKVDIAQGWMFEHSEWMQPHVEGMHKARGLLPLKITDTMIACAAGEGPLNEGDLPMDEEKDLGDGGLGSGAWLEEKMWGEP